MFKKTRNDEGVSSVIGAKSRATREPSRSVGAGLFPACLRHAWQYRRPAPVLSGTLSLRRDDAAVSSVIGALLVLVALTTLLALMQATTVPGMNRDAEAAHADKALEEFFGLQEKVDEAGASGVARTAKITPGTLYPQVPFLYNPNPGTSGNVDLRQGQRVLVQYAANSSTTPISIINQSFCLVGAGCSSFTESNVASITAFTVTAQELTTSPPGNRRLRVQMTGGFGNVNFRHETNDDLTISWPPSGVGVCPGTIPGYFTLVPRPMVDIPLCITGLLSLGSSIDITFTTAGAPAVANGTYTLVGTRGVAGVMNITSVNATAAFLNLTAYYNYWSPPGPVLRYEHGALVSIVNNVALSTAPSAMLGASHNSATNNTTVTVTVPRLNATNASVSQRVPLSLRLTPGPLSRSTATAYNLTLEVGTPFPTLWSAYFSAAMSASGLPAAGNWTVSTGADWARLVIDRGSPPRLNLTVSSATVETAL